MAFFSKSGNILRQVISKPQINHEISASSPSVFQILRFMSSSKLFVGGISWGTNDSSLTDAFSKYGDVVEARVITDRETGRSRGFGFVTFNSVEDASAAIQALDGQMLDGRPVRVNFANEKPRGFGGGGYGGGGYGGSGGGYGGSGGGYGGSGGSYGGDGNYGSGGGYGSSYGGGSGSFGTEGSGGNRYDIGSGSLGYGSDNFVSGASDGNGFGGNEAGDDQNDDCIKRA
ncbi:unnamed protein product [Cuscuta epithymum]|uniref:RRM domain-containing protein n=1 Tax=Cuscuta epithymum TaxID=186058 RepID=A0AAV0F082_9ASTE|nr:unnamed protein product [Cuscuta epithymum]CAH9128808.1 unnamed protein product [Cuscuta epithymum]